MGKCYVPDEILWQNVSFFDNTPFENGLVRNSALEIFEEPNLVTFVGFHGREYFSWFYE